MRLRLYAVCLRGRADSRGVGPLYGLAASAGDLAVVSRRLGVRPLLLGHSMGAFVTALGLVRFPDVFPLGALLVDGGVLPPVSASLDARGAVRAVLRPALRRLTHRFSSADAYVTDWSRHPGLRPALREADPAVLRQIALHDAVPNADGDVLRCGIAAAAVEADAVELFGEAAALAVPTACEQGRTVELLWARRGLLDEPQGFYDETRLARWAPAGLRATCVEDVNHLSVVLVERGVQAIADALGRMSTASSAGMPPLRTSAC